MTTTFPLVDYHCHLDLYPDFETLVANCEKQRIHVLGVTTTPLAWPKNFDLTKGLTHVRAALGLHPQLVAERHNELSIFEKHFDEAKYIGEIGLDAGPAYFKSFGKQEQVFDRITALCSEVGGKILSVHSIRSAPRVLEILEKNKTHLNNRIVLHWFSGNTSTAKRAIAMGCYFSINSKMFLSKNNPEFLNEIPLQRLLTETDGPFTSLNNKPQRPQDVIECVRLLAHTKAIPIDQLLNTIQRNVVTLETNVSS